MIKITYCVYSGYAPNNLGAIKAVGDIYSVNHPKTSKGITDWLKSHITLAVFYLDESDIEKAKKILSDCAEKIKESC